jgi:hypothetical protein
MNMMRLWMKKATEDERLLMAAEIGSTRGNLDQYAGGHRQPSAQRGADIEREAAVMHADSNGRLPLLYRTDLVEACRNCEFARKCLGSEVVGRADFPVVDPE